MVVPMLRTPAHMVAAGVGCVMSIVAMAIPYNLGLIVVGITAMMAGAQTELILERRQVKS